MNIKVKFHEEKDLLKINMDAKVVTAFGDIDSQMSNTSTNAVQNKVIKAYVDAADGVQSAKIEAVKADIEDLQKVDAKQNKDIAILWAASKGKTFTEYEDTEKAYTKAVDANALYGELEMLGGQSVAWNQLIEKSTMFNSSFEETTRGITYSYNAETKKMTINGTATGTADLAITQTGNVSIYANHKYLFLPYCENHIMYDGTTRNMYTYNGVQNGTETSANRYIKFRFNPNTTVENFVVDMSKLMLVDLSALFGLGNEPTSMDDERIKRIEAYAEEHPEYNEGEILSALVDKVVSKGFNLWDEQWELGGISYAGALYDADDRIRSKNFVPVDFTKTYYAKRVVTIVQFDKNKNSLNLPALRPQETNGIFELDANAKFIKFQMASPYHAYYENDVCINESSALNGTYIPYRPPIDKPIPTAITQLDGYGLGIGDVYNSVDFVPRVYHNMKSITLDGSEAWGLYDSSPIRRFGVINYEVAYANNINSISNRFPKINYNEAIDGGYWIQTNWIVVTDSSHRFETVQDFKDYLRENPMILHYEATEGGEDYEALLYYKRCEKKNVEVMSWSLRTDGIFFSNDIKNDVYNAMEDEVPQAIMEHYSVNTGFNVIVNKPNMSFCTKNNRIDYGISLVDNSCTSVEQFISKVQNEHIIYRLATPRIYDVTEILKDFDTELPIEGGGSITFNQLNGTYIQVPNKEKYLTKVV